MSEGRLFQFRVLKNTWALIQDYPSPEKESDVPGAAEPPKLDLYETEKDIIVEVDLPGMNPQGVCIQIRNNRLTLEGKLEACSETGYYLCMERCLEDFRRIVLLPCAVDPERAQAHYERGVLILRLPKIADRRRKAIKIQIK